MSGQLRWFVETRLTNIARFLDHEGVDPAVFMDFVAFLACEAADNFRVATSDDEREEAVISALDTLHAYVLAHNLVKTGYLGSELVAASACSSAAVPGEERETR